ncbi:hypothetical protein BC941DRAFT_413093 [Chlamydoabsidia padenii]|nr:hypothetical protein BC941DRAFT_413093 [Chlamydoabsidia padenii]
MSSSLLFPNWIQTNIKGSKGITGPSTYNCQLAKEKWVNEVTMTINYGKQRKHGERGCQLCDMIAYYYRQTLAESTQHDMDPVVLGLVWEMTKMLLEHLEARLYHSLDWFGEMARDIWQYAKQLKEKEADGELEKAIRITIYHCRALICQQDGDLIKAKVYFRKCVSLSTVFAQQQVLQDAASTFLVHTPSSIYSSHSGSSYFNLPPLLQSPSSISSASTVSSSSSTPILCGHCGLEKKTMPICAKCRSQRYCSSKCLKEHQPIHALSCQKT